MPYQWLIGVGLAIGGSVISNLGVNLQKLTHVREQDEAALRSQQAPHASPMHASSGTPSGPKTYTDYLSGRVQTDAVSESEDLEISDVSSAENPSKLVRQESVRVYEQSSFYTRPLWVLGMSFVVIGAICDFSALAFASQIIVAPLGATTLVSNILFAPYFSKEVLTRTDIVATATIILGSGISVAFAPHDNSDYTYEQLIAFFKDPRFFFYALMVATIVFQIWRTIYQMEMAIISFMQTGPAPLHKKLSLIENLSQIEWGRSVLLQITRFGYACISGITGAHSVLFAKGVAVLSKEDLTTSVGRIGSYLLLGSMLICIFLQIKWMNHGLQHFDALYVVPVFQAFWIGFSIVSGMVVYREAASLTWGKLAAFSVGVSVTLSGVYQLSQRSTGQEQDQILDTFQQVMDRRRRDSEAPDSHPASAGGTVSSAPQSSRLRSGRMLDETKPLVVGSPSDSLDGTHQGAHYGAV